MNRHLQDDSLHVSTKLSFVDIVPKKFEQSDILNIYFNIAYY